MKSRDMKVAALFLSFIPLFAGARELAQEVEYAIGHGAEALICLKVRDDMGQPVSNASVRAIFDMLPSPHSVFGKTDDKGMYVAKGNTNGNRIDFLVGKDGYYGSRKNVSYTQMRKEHDVRDGKWQPYGDVLTICLRPIKNPQKLDSVTVREYKFTDAIGKWLGYDLEQHDYVKPYGIGAVSDFEVYLDWDRIYSLDSKKLGFKIRFPEPMSGYYSVPLDDTSDLQTPYAAVTNETFLREATFYDRDDGRRAGNTFSKSQCWVVRSRCKFDRDGKLKSANYSVVRFLGISGRGDLKAGFCFMGAFNPNLNDTNLEDLEMARNTRLFIRQCEL